MKLTATQFAAVRELIYSSLGLHFEDSKTDFLERRIEKRMTILGTLTADDYLFQLRFLDSNGHELQQLANLITTNETYMFREFEQLQAFADYCLPMTIESKEAAGKRNLKIWSAGCSSGDEAYTLAIIVREVMHDAAHWDINILATDIDEVRFDMAHAATYDDRAVKDVPEGYMDHLKKVRNGAFRVVPATANLVEVRHLNLSDRVGMRAVRGMDFIFCRNVLIYFDDISRKAVVDRFYGSLNPGGFLYLGHSESVGRITSAFKLKRLGPHLVYQKE